jgi:hypothetical protein
MTPRPLPWHDTPTCTAPDDEYAGVSAQRGVCGGSVIDLSENGGGYACGACGAGFRPNAAERAQLLKAEAAWNRVLRGEVHETKVCARCGGCLEIERFRLCAACVEAENAERQGTLFST